MPVAVLLSPNAGPQQSREAAVLSMIWQGRPTLQICLDLHGVLGKCAVDLLVEVGVAVIDEVHILVDMDSASAAELVPLPALLIQLCHHQLHIPLGHYGRGTVQHAVARTVELRLRAFLLLILLLRVRRSRYCSAALLMRA